MLKIVQMVNFGKKKIKLDAASVNEMCRYIQHRDVINNQNLVTSKFENYVVKIPIPRAAEGLVVWDLARFKELQLTILLPKKSRPI